MNQSFLEKQTNEMGLVLQIFKDFGSDIVTKLEQKIKKSGKRLKEIKKQVDMLQKLMIADQKKVHALKAFLSIRNDSYYHQLKDAIAEKMIQNNNQKQKVDNENFPL